MLCNDVFSWIFDLKLQLNRVKNMPWSLQKNTFSYEMLHCCICEILGAQRTKAKTKKKQWWRPWVDHASSRLTPTQPPFFLFLHSDWPLCPWPERWGFPYCPRALKAPTHSSSSLASSQTLVLFCLYLRALVTCSSRVTVHCVRRGTSRWSIKPLRIGAEQGCLK